MTMQGPQPRDGENVAWAGLKEFKYDRPYRTYWNRYGETAYMPADPANLISFMEQGWTLFKPTHPEEKPTQQRMKDGTIFELAGASADLSDVERARINRTPGEAKQAVPTATYYSAQGDAIPDLPADPESMKKYLELGLSLTPPKTEVAV